MNIDLDPKEARRLAAMLASDLASERGRTPEWMADENRRTLAKLQPACQWEDADPLARAIAGGANADAGV